MRQSELIQAILSITLLTGGAMPKVLAQTALVPPAPLPAVPPVTLSIEDAVRRANRRNPLIAAQTARVRGARARALGAGRQPSPTLALAQPYGSNTTGGFDEGVIASQTLEVESKIAPRRAGAKALAGASVLDKAQAENDLALDVRTAYVECLRADGEAGQASDLVSIAEKFRDAARVQFEAGDVPRSNVVRTEIELARARQTLVTAQTDRDNRRATLKSLTGIASNAPLILSDALGYVPRTFALADLTILALRQRPDVQSARRTQTARVADMRAARAQQIPDLIVEGRRTSLNQVQTGNSIRVGVSLPFFDYGRIRADVQSADAAAAEQDALVQEAERVARLDVEIAFREREQAAQIVASFTGQAEGQGRLVRAREILDMVQIGYAQGANSALEVVDAQRTFQSEQVEYLRALAAFQTATARLSRAVGGTLPTGGKTP